MTSPAEKNIPLKNHGYKAKSFFRHGFDFIRRIFSKLACSVHEFDLAMRCLAP
ncbi:MAG: hypothetical protein QNJ51_26370 [Calothrix sp. MO_167.B12]|nr:hypothetical protein [Calothrix sp. MO_167.B12]